jgi:hypothetical protein
MKAKGDVVDEHVRAAPGDPAVVHEFDLFIIHADADAAFVRGFLVPALNLPPRRVLLIDELSLGGVIVSEIDRGVSRSRFTVTVLSPAYLRDRWAVFGEQLANQLSLEDVHIIPLRLMACKLPLRLEARVSLDFTNRDRWEAETRRLRDLLRVNAPAMDQIQCPYPGMRPFGMNEAELFFGRRREIEELVRRLDHGEREIYVVGPSGSGKTSLVQAGLLHTLAAGTPLHECPFAVRTMRPGDRLTDWLEELHDVDLATPAANPTAPDPCAERVLVFIDHLEEVFALTDASERQRIFSRLRSLRVEKRCYLLFALRAHLVGALKALWPDLVGRISRVEVAPLRGRVLAQAITEPAMRLGVHVEAQLCDRLVSDAAVEPGALPLVQATLQLLWRNRRQRLLGLAEYEALGNGEPGLHAAIAQHADATMRTLTVAQQAIAHRILLRLVSFGEGRADTRRQQQVRALQSAAEGAAEFSCVLQRLIAGRLVTVDGSENGDDALVDLSHEALITAWPTLREWVARSRADEHRRRRLEANVSDWIERGCGSGSLLDSVELSDAVRWMQSDAARELGYRTELQALVVASERSIEKMKRQRRRRNAMLVMSSILASILVMATLNPRVDIGPHPMTALGPQRSIHERLPYAEIIRPAETANTLKDDHAWGIAYRLGVIAGAANDLSAAEQYYRSSIDVVEQIRARTMMLEMRPRVLATRRKPYEALFVLLASEHRNAAALAVAEQLHARTWLDALTTTIDPHNRPSRRTPPPAAAPLSVDALLSAIGAREVLVYVEAGGDLWRIHVDGKQIIDGSPLVEVVELSSVEPLLAAWQKHPGESDTAEQLGELLIPSDLAVSARPLYLVVDDRLAELPFPALRRSHRYLIDDRPLVRLPGLAALGCRVHDATMGAAVLMGDSRADLPQARLEVKRLADVIGGQLFVGAEATADALAHASHAELLHLAVHAKLDVRGGVLELADERITAADIVARGIGPRVAVLAGCASGASTDAEGWGSLASAFLVAGSQTVVATLHSVADSDAATVMRAFYDADGAHHPAAALAEAQRILAHDPDRLAVHNTWAEFAVWGNAEPDECADVLPRAIP